jgi:hypothetical protein
MVMARPIVEELGGRKTGVGSLYINRLDDVDIKVLKKMITATAK